MLKIFSLRKKRKVSRDSTPQLTTYQRRSLEYAGIPPAALPYAVYDQMEQDSMIQTSLTLKKLGVLAAPWKIVPPSNVVSDRAKRNADFAEEVLANMDGSPETILHGAMDAFCKGWSAQELVWELGRGALGLRSSGARGQTPNTQNLNTQNLSLRLAAVRPKDPSLFGMEVDPYGQITSLKLQLPGEPPREVPRGKFVVYLNRASYGRTKGRSDLDAAYKHWVAKTSLLNAWKFHLERFAMPTVMGKFQRGMPSDDQAAILSALQNLQDNTAILYPEELTIDTLGGNKEQSAGFMDAIDFHNREIARSILGQTLTTDEGKRVGSLALGKVHLQVLLLQLESLRKELADTVMTEQVIRPLIELNFGPGEIPRFEFDTSRAGAFVNGEIG